MYFHNCWLVIAGSLESANSSILAACSLFAGSLESANSSILAARNLFKDFGGEKSGFYDN